MRNKENIGYAASLLLAIFTMQPVVAQHKLTIYGEVFNKVTNTREYGSVAYLLRGDSSVVDSVKVGGVERYGRRIIRKLSKYSFKDITVPGNYILMVKCNGFETYYKPLNFRKAYKREAARAMPDIFLTRKREQVLDEFTVVATKVKFYNKGDTIVYNADAFQLSEGSMLDELVRQLPGAELKDDGRIYVNGKFVESLMLNGKDFFKGNNSVLLDNLPTYMVKNVKVYEKSSETSKWLGRETDKKSLVMDVGLKKQYNTGWAFNIEAGGGTSDRYLARLFALRFTDHSRLSFYTNVNNTNDSRKPGQNTEWTPEKMPRGIMTSRTAGVDYNLEPRRSPWSMSGNVQAQHTDNSVESHTNRTNFLSAGDTYDRIVSSSRSHDMKLSTQHFVTYKNKAVNFTVKPDFSYHRYRNNGESLSATSSEDLSDMGKDFVDELFGNMLTEDLQQKLLNRNMSSYKKKGYEWNFNNIISANIKIPHTSDFVGFRVMSDFKGADNDYFDINRIDYFANGGTVDYRNNYTQGTPSRGYKYDVSALYNYFVKKGMITSLTYGYAQEYQYKSRSLYRLDRISGWEEGSYNEIGSLPSVSEYENVLDASNSYRSGLWDRTHYLTWNLFWSKTKENGSYLSIDAYMNLPYHRQKMNYERGGVDTTLTRNKLQIKAYCNFEYSSGNGKHNVSTGYNISSSLPDLSYAANVTDDSNPLLVTHGNDHLKTIYDHTFDISYSYRLSKKQIIISPNVKYTYHQNALAMGYVYDRTTGRRDITPDNVNGNWDLTFALNTTMPFDKKKTLLFKNNLAIKLYHSVDLTGVDGASSAVRSTVMTRQIGDDFTLEKTFGKQKISLKGSFTNIHTTGSLDNFEAINAYNYSYGLLGTFKLPWKLELSTDVTMYSRRGYGYEEMNSDDLLWNARLSRPFFKGKFVAMIDAFDILHQLSNVQRYMNAQARTETYVNSLPRYVVFHFIYRLNLNPKKKR